MSFLAVVTFQSDTGEDRDAVQNTFTIATNVAGEDLSVADEADINQAFSDLYNATGVDQTGPINLWLSPVLSNIALDARLDLYDIEGNLDGSPHGSPFSSTLFTLDAAAGGTPFPSEVAICVTLEAIGRAAAPVEAPDGADPGVQIDRPQQRRTGRWFYGPMRSTGAAVVAGVARPLTELTDNLREATRNLHDNLDAISPEILGLGVWSRSDEVVRVLEAVSTDNAFDIQRRRGEAPVARTRLAV